MDQTNFPPCTANALLSSRCFSISPTCSSGSSYSTTRMISPTSNDSSSTSSLVYLYVALTRYNTPGGRLSVVAPTMETIPITYRTGSSNLHDTCPCVSGTHFFLSGTMFFSFFKFPSLVIFLFTFKDKNKKKHEKTSALLENFSNTRVINRKQILSRLKSAIFLLMVVDLSI